MIVNYIFRTRKIWTWRRRYVPKLGYSSVNWKQHATIWLLYCTRWEYLWVVGLIHCQKRLVTLTASSSSVFQITLFSCFCIMFYLFDKNLQCVIFLFFPIYISHPCKSLIVYLWETNHGPFTWAYFIIYFSKQRVSDKL